MTDAKRQPAHAVILSRNLTAHPITTPVITVEATGKWYSLWLVREGIKYEPITYDAWQDLDLEHGHGLEGPPYVDHTPNPFYVVRYAKKHGYDIDPVALEVMVGRWEMEFGLGYADMMEELDS